MSAGTEVRATASYTQEQLEALDRVQRRVLWLAVSMIHHANSVRGKGSGVKVGGHQASSASMVSIMTALYFEHLKGGDQVSVKPHASPVLHAINYLLGRLDERYLTELRAYGGLQSYPSRTKDPDPVDFSTGSVGIGATASIWSAIAQRYVSNHFEHPGIGRRIALVGDAELDEGPVWEAVMDPVVPRLGEVLWIVDLNRQSLDRVVPGIAASRIRDMFSAVGWNTITLKYGARLRQLFALEDGELLERRIDEMSNEEYQYLLRLPASELRTALAGPARPVPISPACSVISMMPTSLLRCATSAATTSATCSTPSLPPTGFRTVHRLSSPTRSRPGACRRPGTRGTIRRSCRTSNGASWASTSGPTPIIPGPASRLTARRAPSAQRPQNGSSPRNLNQGHR